MATTELNQAGVMATDTSTVEKDIPNDEKAQEMSSESERQVSCLQHCQQEPETRLQHYQMLKATSTTKEFGVYRANCNSKDGSETDIVELIAVQGREMDGRLEMSDKRKTTM